MAAKPAPFVVHHESVGDERMRRSHLQIQYLRLCYLQPARENFCGSELVVPPDEQRIVASEIARFPEPTVRHHNRMFGGRSQVSELRLQNQDR